MKTKWVLVAILASLLAQPGMGVEALSSTILSPGDYTVSIMPDFNSEMAARIEKSLGQLDGMDNVKAHPLDSSMRFTVKAAHRVDTLDVQKALGNADTGAVMTTPVLENSLSTKPGL